MVYSIEMIVAMDSNGVIGITKGDNVSCLPWSNIPEDMEYFRRMTENNIVIMGRKTWESLPNSSKPLKNRINIILSTDEFFKSINGFKDIYVVDSLNSLVDLLDSFPFFKQDESNSEQSNLEQSNIKLNNQKKIFVIGGAQLYKQFLPITNTLYITEINTNDIYANPIYFPKTLKEIKESNMLDEDKWIEEQPNTTLSLKNTGWLYSKNSKHSAYRFHVFNRNGRLTEEK